MIYKHVIWNIQTCKHVFYIANTMMCQLYLNSCMLQILLSVWEHQKFVSKYVTNIFTIQYICNISSVSKTEIMNQYLTNWLYIANWQVTYKINCIYCKYIGNILILNILCCILQIYWHYKSLNKNFY